MALICYSGAAVCNGCMRCRKTSLRCDVCGGRISSGTAYLEIADDIICSDCSEKCDDGFICDICGEDATGGYYLLGTDEHICSFCYERHRFIADSLS